MTNIHNIHLDFLNSWKLIQQRWKKTITLWDDGGRYQFEREYWQPLETEMAMTLREMERLDTVITQIKHNKKF